MPISHMLVALALQLAIGLLTGSWWTGAAFGAALYVGREQAQAEYRWIRVYGSGLRARLPWWGGYDPRVWDRKSALDVLGPVAVVLAVAILFTVTGV